MKWPNLLNNETTDLLPVIDFKACPRERCFSGMRFPSEQAEIASAELELVKQVLREEHGPLQDFVKVLKIVWNFYFTLYNVSAGHT